MAFVVAERIQGPGAMFDLSLFRKPTFTGGSIAAFSLSAGLFALLLYLTLYLQDILGYSALQTGLRFLLLSGGILLTSTLAGRLTAVVPIRWLIAPGLALVGVGLLLMRGLTASSHWTHLIPGFAVVGAGTGLINPPLASTAIGVVPPERAGMASGINSTFRQVGIATGIAGLGSVSLIRCGRASSRCTGPCGRGEPSPGARAGRRGGPGQRRRGRSGPDPGRGTTGSDPRGAKVGFVIGLNRIFLIGAALTLVASLLTLALIREQDFEDSSARRPAAADPRASAPDAAPLTSADGAKHDPDLELLRRAEAVALAAEQAAADYRDQIERQIEHHRAAELAAAGSRHSACRLRRGRLNDEYAPPPCDAACGR